MFSHKDVLPSGRILVFMITLGKTFFYLSVSTFIIASLDYFNEYLFEHGLIDEMTRNKLRIKIITMEKKS